MHRIKSVHGCLLTQYGANNAFDKVRKSIFQACLNENFRSLKRLIIFLPETTGRRDRPTLPLPRPYHSAAVPAREWDLGWNWGGQD